MTRFIKVGKGINFIKLNDKLLPFIYNAVLHFLDGTVTCF